ncbi:hypothetical protein BD413DRAFT_224865 [Trametes elegans]|nr:hypothetical protein BD413DRAFT_224865 [Trametes elegans]
MPNIDQSQQGVLISYLTSFFLDCLCFGVFFVTYAITIWILVFNERRRQQRNKNMDIAQAALLTLMLVIALCYLILDVVVNVHAFAGDSGDLAAAENLFLVENPGSLWGPKLALLVTQTILADGFLIYRVYAVWSRSFLISLVPTIFLLCDAAFGYAMVNFQIHRESDNTDDKATTLADIMTKLFIASSLVTNVLSTGLIAARIIISNRRVSDFRIPHANGQRSQRSGLLDIMVQSAALYLCALLIVLVTMFTVTKEPLVVLGFLPSLAGFVFSLVIVRTHLSDATNTDGVHRVDLSARRAENSRAAGMSIHIVQETSSFEDK